MNYVYYIMDIIYNIVNNAKIELINIKSFINKKLAKLIKLASLTTATFILIYFYTLKLDVLHNLYGLDRSFFAQEDLELKIWNGFFEFIDLLLSRYFLYVLFLVAICLFFIYYMLYVISLISNEKSEKITVKILLKSFSFYFLGLITLITIYGFFKASSLIEIKMTYDYMKHTHFCDHFMGSNTQPIIIVQNKTVPYQLMLVESKILYFQPNQNTVTWSDLSSKESDIKEMCHKL